MSTHAPLSHPSTRSHRTILATTCAHHNGAYVINYKLDAIDPIILEMDVYGIINYKLDAIDPIILKNELAQLTAICFPIIKDIVTLSDVSQATATKTELFVAKYAELVIIALMALILSCESALV